MTETNSRGSGMNAVKKLEDRIGSLLKGAPSLPDSSREALVGFWPWVALIFGFLQLIAAWALINLLRTADKFLDYSSFYIRNPGALSAGDKAALYIGIFVLVADAVILLMAYPELLKRRRKGWYLLFIGSLLNVAYSVISLFIQSRGVGTFLFSLIGSVVGFYLLYQVRGKYGSVKSAKKA